MEQLQKEFYNLIKSDDIFLDFFLNYALDGVCFIDFNDFNKFWCNKKLELSLNYSHNEINNNIENINNVFHPDDVIFLKENILSSIKTVNEIKDCRLRFQNKLGFYSNLDTHILYYSDELNLIERVLIFIKEVSTNQEEFKQIEKVNEHLLFLMQSTGDLIFVLDKNFNYSECYGAPENMFTNTENLIGKNYLDYKFQEPAFSKIYNCLKNSLSEKNDQNIEYFIEINDKTLWYNLVVKNIFNTQKNTVELLCVCTNISQIKEKETKLNTALKKISDNEIKWKFALEGTGDGMWDWDIINNTVYFSKQWKEMLGYKEHEILNSIEEWEKRVHPDDLKKAYLDLENHINGLTPIYKNEHRLLCKDGTYKWISDKGKIYEYTEDGRPSRFIGTKCDINQRKIAELELFNNKQIIESLFTNLPGIAYRCYPDNDFTVIFISKQVKNITGYNDTDFVQNKIRSFSSIIHPDDLANVQDLVTSSLESNKTFEIEYRIIHASGKIIWVRERGNGIYNYEGELKFLDGIILDITERKKVKDDLYRTKEMLIQAGRLAKVGWWEFDILSNQVIWSEITKDIHEVPSDYTPTFDSTMAMYKDSEEKENILKHIDQAIKFGKPWECELQIITSKGKEKWVSVIGNTEIVDGKCIRLYGSLQDIDEIKKNNQKLKSFEILNKLTNSVPGIVYKFEQATNKSYKFTFLSENVKDVQADLTKEDMLNDPTSVIAMVYKDDVGIFTESMRKAFYNFEPWQLDYRIQNKDGSIVWHRGLAKPEKQEDGTITWYGYVYNITDFKKLQHSLQEKVSEVLQKNEELLRYINKNKELERFAYIVSHDLKEPLRTIKAFSEILLTKYIENLDENAQTYFQYIISSAERMTQLIEGILDYSKIEDSHHIVEKIETSTLINIVISDLNSSIKESNATIHFDVLHEINGNPIQIRQLFQNIISNAIKFVSKERNPQVIISSEAQENNILFTIKDNGIGICKENFETIFSMFKRLHSRDAYTGHGVGLALCKKIVEIHKGEIWVESDGATGTTFFISFPIQ